MSAENKRGPISEVVGGDILIVNSSYSGKLTDMSDEALKGRLAELLDADPEDEDSDEAFMNCQNEITAIEAELQWRHGRGISK